jgi:V/A-type H+-transporting ATPase subunit K
MKPRLSVPIVLTALAALLGGLGTAMLLASSGLAAPETGAAAGAAAGGERGWGLIAAALSTGLASLGAGFAVARVGTAAVAALAEKPELLGRLLIFVGLAEGIAIYGLIISILILDRLA